MLQLNAKLKALIDKLWDRFCKKSKEIVFFPKRK